MSVNTVFDDVDTDTVLARLLFPDVPVLLDTSLEILVSKTDTVERVLEFSLPPSDPPRTTVHNLPKNASPSRLPHHQYTVPGTDPPEQSPSTNQL
jgi:hypothetical protein